MKLSIKAGSTSQSINIFIQDSSSTTGAGLTGLTNASAGMTAYYSFSGTNTTAVNIPFASLALVTSAFSAGGFIAIDGTNMPGWYRFDIPDAALATSKGRSVAIHLKGATNMAPLPIEIELTGWDNQDATAGGLSRLDAAVTSRMATFTLPTNFSSLAITGGGAVTAGTVSDKTGYSLSQTFPTNFSALAITAGGAVTAGTVSDKTGYSISGTKTTLDALNDIAAGAAMTLTAAERNSTADALLGRNVSGGSSTGRTVKQALHFLRNKWAVSAGTLTVYDTDDTTASWTATVGTDATANPIVSNDPA